MSDTPEPPAGQPGAAASGGAPGSPSSEPTGGGSQRRPPSRSTEDRMLAAAQAGDASAFAALIKRCDPLCTRLADRLLEGHGTDDTVQAAYVRAYRALPRHRGPALPWLVRLTYLAALDELRHRARREAGGPGRKPRARPAGTAAGAPATTTRPDLLAVLALADGERWGPRGVAAVLGTDPRTVVTLRDRARAEIGRLPDRQSGPPPEHRAGFWEELAGELGEEREAPAPVSAATIESTSSLEGEPGPSATAQRRRPRRGRRRRGRRGRGDDGRGDDGRGAGEGDRGERADGDGAGVRSPAEDHLDGLATAAERQQSRPSVRRRMLQVGTGLVILAALGGAVYGVVRIASDAQSPVRENSVAELADETTRVLANAGGMRASITRTTSDASGSSTIAYLYAQGEGGSFRLAEAESGRQVVYASSLGVLVTRGAAPQEPVEPPPTTIETGLAAGPPDPYATAPGLILPDLATALRALSGVDDERASETQLDGRSAWELTGPIPGAGDDPLGEATLVVDRSTLAPMRLSLSFGQGEERAYELAEVALEPIGPEAFDPGLDPALAGTEDRGFAPVPVDEIEGSVSYEPVMPDVLPDGFSLAAATVNEDAEIVSLRYNRGPQRVVVSLRPAPATGDFTDPFDRPDGSIPPTSLLLDGGAFRGTTVSRLVSPTWPPALWGSDGDLAFTVAGDLSGSQLVEVAESLG